MTNAIAAALFSLLLFSLHRTTYLDVATGVRDGDYGSNHGWHWPWTPVIQICFCGLIACVLQ